jgi:Replication-relaxation
MEMTATRARRFERAEDVAECRITERDVRILHNLWRRRFLSTDHLVALDGGNAANVKARLRVLFDQGFIDRPEAQRQYSRHTTPGAMVHALGRAGARFLREHGEAINPNIDLSEKNRRAGSVFVSHTLGVADFLVNLEVACRNSPDQVQLISQHQLLAVAPEKTRASREPLRWQAAMPNEKAKPQSFSVIPDGMFALLSPSAPREKNVNIHLLEIDRGTIPIRRKGQGHRSIRHKLNVYLRGWLAKRHVQQFGTPAVQVAIVTNSPVRVEHMLDEVLDLTGGAGSRIFLFTDQQTLAAAGGDPLKAKWINGKGELTALSGE